MKKVGLILGIFVVIISLFVFINKLYYPALPIDGLSAKDALNKVEKSTSKLAEFAKEDDFNWYITSSKPNGILTADENIKQMIRSYGWEFYEKEGSGLFFEKAGEKLIVTTQMWTKNYVLVKVPSNFN